MNFNMLVKKAPQNGLVSKCHRGIQSLIIFLVNSDLHLNYKLHFARINLQCCLKKYIFHCMWIIILSSQILLDFYGISIVGAEYYYS